MRSAFFAILCLALLGACASKKEGMKSKQGELYFGAGTQNLLDQEYTLALQNLIKANDLEPNNSEIMNNLGMAYYFKGEVDLAVKYLEQAIILKDKNTDAKVNLASIYFNQGKADEAEALYKKVLKDLTYEKQARTYYNLGIVEIDRKNTDAAEKYFKRSLVEDDNYCPAYFQLGLMQFKRRQFNTALKNFKEAALGTCYNAPAPVYYQALTLAELKQYEDSRIRFEEVISRFAKSDYATKARAKTLELNKIESRYKMEDMHASGKVLESPDF